MKLSKTLRSAIAAQLADNALHERKQTRAIAEHELALAIYAHVYKPTTRKAMDKLPEGWLPSTHVLHIRLSSGNDLDSTHYVALPAPRRVLAKHDDSAGRIVLPKESAFADQLNKLYSEARAIELLNTELRRQARLTLAPITTLKQLGERWPEALPVAMGVVEKYRRIAPAQGNSIAAPAELNSALGLTPAAKAVKAGAARKAAPRRAAKKAD